MAEYINELQIVGYQRGFPEQFGQRYFRLKVKTSMDLYGQQGCG